MMPVVIIDSVRVARVKVKSRKFNNENAWQLLAAGRGETWSFYR